MDAVLVRTTVGTEAQALALAMRLIEERQAACVHRQKVHSVFRWDDRIEDATEWLVEARAPADQAESLRSAMLDGHPYTVPLVETLKAWDVPPGYMAWMGQVMASTAAPAAGHARRKPR